MLKHKIKQKYAAGQSISGIARDLDVSRQLVWYHLKAKSRRVPDLNENQKIRKRESARAAAARSRVRRSEAFR